MFELTIDDRIGRIGINRSDKRNAVTNAAWRDLANCVREASAAECKILLLHSLVDGVFCAGADVGEFVIPGEGASPDIAGPMREGIDALASATVPTIAYVDGGCFGAGVALMLACDVCVAGKAARFGIPPAKLGVAYPAEDLARLAVAVGRAQAARLIFSGETIDAEEALRIGLVQFGANSTENDAYCAGIAANPGASLIALKRLLDLGINAEFGREGDDLFRQSFQSEDFAKGVIAFRSGEKAVFD